MLQITGLSAGYGSGRVLDGVSFEVKPGEIVALLGRNGAGRSTLLRCLMGLMPVQQGRVAWQGRTLTGLAPHRIARLGVGYVPESRDVFPQLTVMQNLALGRRQSAAGWTAEQAFERFPPLAARAGTLAGRLSGGEQQMLSLCRSLMPQPGLLLLDEPTEGLAPAMSARVAQCLREQRAQGKAVLLVEQKQALGLDIADRVLVMGQGRIVFDGRPDALRADMLLQAAWLRV